MKIVSVGEITIDRYWRQNLSFVGGISLNFAVNAKRSGAETVSLVSCIGNGPEGAWVLDTLARERVDSSHIAILEGKTAECAVEVYDDAERVFPIGGYKANVLSRLHLTDDIKSFISQHDILVTLYDGNKPESLTMQLLQLSINHGKRVVDFGDWTNGNLKEFTREALNKIDLAFITGDEATIKDLLPIAESVECLIVITLGAAGSVALTAGGVVTQSAIRIDNPVDSNGCGDAFQAAFTVNYLRDGNIAAALHQGAIQAARVLKHYGAFSQIPIERKAAYV
jgi:sugar/nucleoside kinase (ribokinase family)